MSPAELAVIIDDIVQNADQKYIKRLVAIQNDLYSQLSTILKDLETDSGGYVKQNSANRKIINQAQSKIGEVFSDNTYTNTVSDYVSSITKIDLSNVKYFTAIDDTFSPKRAFLKSLQSETIATINQYVMDDGLQSQVVQPLVQILNENINSGGQFSGFLQQIKDYVTGNEKVEGRAMSYTRTYLKDALFNYSRGFQQAITADLGLVWYFYSGGLIDTSRDFCIERSGKYFHQKEIEAWASLSWSGKRPGTTESSIFIYAGGFGCIHQIIPVSKVIVPKEDLDRVKT